MLVVAVHSELVTTLLAAGVGPRLPGDARCPYCKGPLSPWTSYTRMVRHRAITTRLRVHRCRCRRCERTHALLPSFLLAYGRDVVATVGQALVGGARGLGHRPLARDAGLPAATVRGWLRRARRAAHTRMTLARGLYELGGNRPGRPRAETRSAGYWTRSPRSIRPPARGLTASIAARSLLPLRSPTASCSPARRPRSNHARLTHNRASGRADVLIERDATILISDGAQHPAEPRASSSVSP